MHIAMIIDDERLMHEGPMFNRLSVGLMSEGEQVSWIHSSDAIKEFAEDSADTSLIPRIGAPMRVPRWIRPLRTRALVENLERSTPDAILAVGIESWSLAHDLAANLGIPLVLDIWAPHVLAHLPSRRQLRTIAAFLTPSEHVSGLLSRKVDPALITTIRPGVSPREASRSENRQPNHASVCVAVLSTGRVIAPFETFFKAMAQLRSNSHPLELFIELRGHNAHEIWESARNVDLLSSVSSLSNADELRRLLLRCDVLAIPEAGGEYRGIMLEAMAAGIPLLLAADPALETLQDGHNCRVVDSASTQAWQDAVADVLASPRFRQTIRHGAWQTIRTLHASQRQLEMLLQIFRQIVHGEVLAFPTKHVTEG